MDECDEICQVWLNLVTGMVDPEADSLNISQTTLQRNKILRMIKKTLVKECLVLLAGNVEKVVDVPSHACC